MNPTRRSASWIAAVLVAVAVALPVAPAGAAPSSSIVAVFDVGDCASEVCDPASDPKLPERSVAKGKVQVHVRSQAQFGLEWVRLEAAHGGSEIFACVQFWRLPAGTFSFEETYTWDTASWPNPPSESGCEDNFLHYHGALAKNGPYELRVRAKDRNPDPSQQKEELDSDRFPITYRNAPIAAQWLEAPRLTGTPEAPSVRLRWLANPEEQAQPEPVGDVLEYHVVRARTGGGTLEFAVNAGDPAAQGCRRIGGFYECHDDAFTTGGEYRYAVIASRSGGIAACRTAAARCIDSSIGEVHDIGVEVAAAASPSSASAIPDGRLSPVQATSSPGLEPGSPTYFAPPASRDRQLATAAAPDVPTAAVSIAALLVVGLVIAHARRLVR